jgi:hypothetical protein
VGLGVVKEKLLRKLSRTDDPSSLLDIQVYGLLYNISKDSFGLIKYADSEVVAVLFQVLPFNSLATRLTRVEVNGEPNSASWSA